jgi:hypothetical protein
MGSYWPYATTLFDYIRRAMPYSAPGSISVDDTYAVAAYFIGAIPSPLDTREDGLISSAKIRVIARISRQKA